MREFIIYCGACHKPVSLSHCASLPCLDVKRRERARFEEFTREMFSTTDAPLTQIEHAKQRLRVGKQRLIATMIIELHRVISFLHRVAND